MADYQIDNVDLQILEILSKNARTAYTEIAEKLIVSAGTIHVRMKKMEAAGIVKGTEIVVNPIKLGFDLTAFIGVFLDKGASYDNVIDELNQIDEITEAYYTTGGYSIFLKVMCKNTENLRLVLNEKIQRVSGILRTETIISLEQSIRRKAPLQTIKTK
ncbi:MAG: Lrp/AsnC ligand binding domain-containing protein [Flavobacteriales bacterium]|nr:Lrp/AsnC ligand binding domain-containing protein [Flavobacteriales bacterium]